MLTDLLLLSCSTYNKILDKHKAQGWINLYISAPQNGVLMVYVYGLLYYIILYYIILYLILYYIFYYSRGMFV